MQGPPDIVFLAEMLALPTTKGVFWLVRPWVFWLQPFQKGVMVLVVPLGTAPMLNASELELMSGALIPQSIGVTNRGHQSPKGKRSWGCAAKH